MSEDQISYWSLFAVTVSSFLLGIWIFFGIEGLAYKRTEMLRKKIGEKPVRVFVVIMRLLGFLLVLLTSYLLVGLWRVLPCALK